MVVKIEVHSSNLKLVKEEECNKTRYFLVGRVYVGEEPYHHEGHEFKSQITQEQYNELKKMHSEGRLSLKPSGLEVRALNLGN